MAITLSSRAVTAGTSDDSCGESLGASAGTSAGTGAGAALTADSWTTAGTVGACATVVAAALGDGRSQ
jgi:hypothetical protein